MNDQRQEGNKQDTYKDDAQEKALALRNETPIQNRGGLFIPQTMRQALKLAEVYARSGLVPNEYRGNHYAVFVAWQYGASLGLDPFASLQNIAMVGGKPSVYGDAMLGLVRSSGLLEFFLEYIDGTGESANAICIAKRKGQGLIDADKFDPNQPMTYWAKCGWATGSFSVAEAKRAGLWGGTGRSEDAKKQSGWYKYPQRMLRFRARSFCLRDGFGDLLKGLYAREEMEGGDIAVGDPIAIVTEPASEPQAPYVIQEAEPEPVQEPEPPSPEPEPVQVQPEPVVEPVQTTPEPVQTAPKPHPVAVSKDRLSLDRTRLSNALLKDGVSMSGESFQQWMDEAKQLMNVGEPEFIAWCLSDLYRCVNGFKAWVSMQRVVEDAPIQTPTPVEQPQPAQSAPQPVQTSPQASASDAKPTADQNEYWTTTAPNGKTWWNFIRSVKTLEKAIRTGWPHVQTIALATREQIFAKYIRLGGLVENWAGPAAAPQGLTFVAAKSAAPVDPIAPAAQPETTAPAAFDGARRKFAMAQMDYPDVFSAYVAANGLPETDESAHMALVEIGAQNPQLDLSGGQF